MGLEIMLSPNYFMFGMSWFSIDEEYDYNEVNFYLLCLKISFTW